MATRFLFRNFTPRLLTGAGDRVVTKAYGGGLIEYITTTTAGGTNIQSTDVAGGTALQWYSEPLSDGQTISGTVTVTVRGNESANAVNAGPGIFIQRTDGSGTVISTLVADQNVPTAGTTEWTTTNAAVTGTYTPTSTTFAAGDRIKFTLKHRNVGTMGAGTARYGVNGRADLATNSGNTKIEFTEDFRTDEPMEGDLFVSGGYYGGSCG